ncbi:hypothetical protein [Lentzea californiensis]|uniref:hypothetical protein n=1 Tax=Lentzea californiensis TaxID=438851 RepID=UPI0021661AE8|nr:hypothetical protein [Lentzea californiensis]MCR3753418.1 hypothetical protein [Lentzea californiensis]
MAGAVGIVFGLCVLSFTLGAALMYVLVRRREDADSRDPAPAAPDERTWVEKPVAVVPVDDEYDSRPIHRNPVMGLPQMEPALASLAEPVVELASVVKPEQVIELTPVVEFEPVPMAGQVTKSAPGMKAEPVVEPEQLAAPETVGAARYDRDGDLAPPMGDFEAPESTVAPSTDSPEPVAKPVELTKLTESAKPAEPAPAEPAGPETEALAEATAEPPAEETEPEPAPQSVAQPVVQTALPPPASPQPAEHTTWVEREDFRQRYLRTFEEVRRKAGSN